MDAFIIKNFSKRWSLLKSITIIVAINLTTYLLAFNLNPDIWKPLRLLIWFILFYFFNRILVSKRVNAILCWVLSAIFAVFPLPMIFFLWKAGEN